MKILLIILIAFTFIACKKDSEKYVAKVNGEGISRTKFEKIISKRFEHAEKFGQKITPAQRFTVEKRLLENFINEELLLQEAKKKSIKVENSKVDERLQTIKSRYPKPEEFKSILASQGMTEKELKEMLQRQLTIERLIQEDITDKIEIPNNDLKKYYKQHKAQFKVPDQVQASHILLKTKAKRGSKEEKIEQKKLKAKLSKIRKEIVSKKTNFAAAAKKHSECPSKSKGGDLGLFSKGRMVKEFEKVAFSTPINKVSKPFKSPFGYHILKVSKKTKARTKPFKEAKEDIIRRLKNQQYHIKIKDYITGLKNNAKIVSFLKEPAPEPSSGTKAPAKAPKQLKPKAKPGKK